MCSVSSPAQKKRLLDPRTAIELAPINDNRIRSSHSQVTNKTVVTNYKSRLLKVLTGLKDVFLFSYLNYICAYQRKFV